MRNPTRKPTAEEKAEIVRDLRKMFVEFGATATAAEEHAEWVASIVKFKVQTAEVRA